MKNFPSNINRIQLVDDLKTVYYLVNKNIEDKSQSYVQLYSETFSRLQWPYCESFHYNGTKRYCRYCHCQLAQRERSMLGEIGSRHVAGDNCRKESDGLLFLISNRPSLCKGQPLFKR